MHAIRWLGATAMLGILACQQAETPEQRRARMEQETAAFAAVVEADAATYARLADAGKGDSLAAMFTEQATYTPPNEPVVMGRQAIGERYATQAGWGQWSRTIMPTASWASGDLGVAHGRIAVRFTPGRGAPRGMTAVADTARWMAHFQRVDDRWLIADLIWNSGRPAPGAARR